MGARFGQPEHEGGWTDDRANRLRALWTDGFPASYIAAELGGGLTPNGVIGKVHRMGLPSRKTKSLSPSDRARLSELKAKKRLANQLALRATSSDYANAPKQQKIGRQVQVQDGAISGWAEPAGKYTPPDPSTFCTLGELTDTRCRWPVGDPRNDDFRFCGAEGADMIEGRAYCPSCRSIAYSPVLTARSKAKSEATRNSFREGARV